jgi:diacylglycerol kinase
LQILYFWLRKFGYAFRGIKEGVRQEASLRVHILALILIIALAVWLRVSLVEGAVLALAVGAVWAAELLNTAIERVARAMHQPNDPQLRDALDIAAGGVLMISIGAAIAGVSILGTKLWVMFFVN